MRLLHTADWHLGRSFHGASLLDAQAAWADWLVAVASEGAVDAVLVSGDLYDRALPPVDAVRLADEALARLVEIAPVVVISGNHDSAARLAFGSGLFERAGLHLRTDVARIGEPVLIGDCAIYPIPYLEPDVARPLLEVEGRGHGPVLAAAMDCVRDDIALRAGLRTVVMAHAFVAGAAASESERDLSVGGVYSVPPSTFAGVDYVALGHVHSPQPMGSNGRYAGSPLAFSFSEAAHVKSVALVDLAGSELDVELVACPVPRPLAVLRGQLAALLSDPAHAGAEQAWVHVTLTDAVRPADAMERLRARFAYTVALSFEPEGATRAEGSYAQRLSGLGDRELAAAFLEEVRGAGPDAGEQELLDAALAAARVAEASAEVSRA
jgi:exonuclease SbcD